MADAAPLQLICLAHECGEVRFVRLLDSLRVGYLPTFQLAQLFLHLEHVALLGPQLLLLLLELVRDITL